MTELLAAATENGALENLVEAIRASAEHPWIQGWLTAVATFFFENVICWTVVPPLISTDIVGCMTAWQSTFWGVFVGDILMYLPVRFAMRYIIRLRWLQRNQDKIEACGHFFGENLGKTMFVIRFTPGIRTFALIAAGMLRVPFGPYVFWSAVSCALQSTIVTFFMPSLYEPAIAWAKRTWESYPSAVILVIVAFFLAFIVFQWAAAKAAMKRAMRPPKVKQPKDTAPPAA